MTDAVARKRGRPKKVTANPAPKKAAPLNDPELNSLNELVTAEIKVRPLEEQSWEELFTKARDIYKLNVTEDYTKEDLILAIRGRSQRKIDVIDARKDNVEVKPGYAKIELYKDPTPKTSISAQRAASRPVYVAVNGYRCTIPKGIPVIVPLKVVEVLRNAVERIRVADENPDPRNRDIAPIREITAPRFPFTVHEQMPGNDPKPGDYDQAKKVYHTPRQKYYEQFGLWPNSVQLREAIQDGIVSLR